MQLFDDLEDFGSFDDAVSGDVRDPYSDLALRRREGPVQRLEISGMPHDAAKPIFMLYRYDEIAQVLRDNQTFSSSIIINFFGDALGQHVMLGMDEPEHRRYRALVSAAFTQRALARRQDELVARVAGDLIDRFAGRGRAELVREFTFPYPTQIIAGLLGLPREDYPQFQRWSISLLSIIVNRERAVAASKALRDYFAPILEARRVDPRDDLISLLAQAEIDGEHLSDEEIFSFLRLLLPAGVETTYRSTGNLLFGLLSHPEQLGAVRADRSLIPQAIEEAVRWEAPLLTITRVATRDSELAGVPIPAGSTVMPLLGAANRDETRYPDPDRFDIFRAPKPAISWGHGIHVCLGMHLARLEMRVALELLLDRLPGLRLDPEAVDPHIPGRVPVTHVAAGVSGAPALYASMNAEAALEFNPYDPELHRDPYPVYRRLRDEFPVHHNPRLRFWTLSRHADVLDALQAPDRFISGKGVVAGLPDADLMKSTGGVPLLITTDRPRHTKLRALVSRAFTPRRVALLEPRIRAIARSLLDGIKGRPEFDLVRELSAPLPTIVIAEMLGVPVEDQEWFKEKSNAVAEFDPTKGGNPAEARAIGPAVELGRYLAGILEQRRSEPRDDLLSALLAAEIDGQRLSEAELIGFAFLLLVAGNETTTNLISNAAILLDRHRDQRRLLIEDPARIPGAIEEFLRYDSPVQGLARTLATPVTLHGVTIPEGDKVLLLFGSANRDERKISDPERFDVSRDPNPHLAFGFGAHFCLGANLARLEARVAFEELLARLPDYRMTESRVQRTCSGPIRGALSLPIAAA